MCGKQSKYATGHRCCMSKLAFGLPVQPLQFLHDRLACSAQPRLLPTPLSGWAWPWPMAANHPWQQLPRQSRRLPRPTTPCGTMRAHTVTLFQP